MSFLADDFDSLTALPLGIWQSENECPFNDLSLHNPVRYNPVCTENQLGSTSPTISKTYAELHVFPKVEPDVASSLPPSNLFSDITNTDSCDQSTYTVMETENYQKGQLSAAVTTPVQFSDSAITNFATDLLDETSVSKVLQTTSLEETDFDPQTTNTKKRHIVRLTRNKTTRRGASLAAKEIDVSLNGFTAFEQPNDDAKCSKRNFHSIKGKTRATSSKTSQKNTKMKNRNKQNKKKKLKEFEELEAVGVCSRCEDTGSLGKKGKAKFKAEKWNMVFQRKAFLIRYSDVDFFDSNQIWCVVNHKVIRKYVLDRCLPEGKRVYKKTNRLAGWLCNESQHYYCVEVIEVGKDYEEVIIVYPEIEKLRMARNSFKLEENSDEKVSFASCENSNSGSNDVMEPKIEMIEDNENFVPITNSSIPSDETDPWGTTLLEEEDDDEGDDEIEEE